MGSIIVSFKRCLEEVALKLQYDTVSVLIYCQFFVGRGLVPTKEAPHQHNFCWWYYAFALISCNYRPLIYLEKIIALNKSKWVEPLNGSREFRFIWSNFQFCLRKSISYIYRPSKLEEMKYYTRCPPLFSSLVIKCM